MNVIPQLVAGSTLRPASVQQFILTGGSELLSGYALVEAISAPNVHSAEHPVSTL
jgi:hypothetical protein